jgi:hypothetical protein
VHKGAFARGMNFIFHLKLFFVDWRLEVVDNVKCLSIGLLNVYVCYVINQNKLCSNTLEVYCHLSK